MCGGGYQRVAGVEGGCLHACAAMRSRQGQAAIQPPTHPPDPPTRGAGGVVQAVHLEWVDLQAGRQAGRQKGVDWALVGRGIGGVGVASSAPPSRTASTRCAPPRTRASAQQQQQDQAPHTHASRACRHAVVATAPPPPRPVALTSTVSLSPSTVPVVEAKPRPSAPHASPPSRCRCAAAPPAREASTCSMAGGWPGGRERGGGGSGGLGS